MVSEEQWMSITETAIELGIRYQRARDLVIVGKLGESKKEGRYYFVRRSEVERYKREEAA